MIRKYLAYYILTGLLFLQNVVLAQPDSGSSRHLVVSYLLNIESGKKSGIAESYNGAVKTIFMSEGKARSRMVSLMRVQSIFYTANETGEKISMVKESGKESYKTNFTGSQWKEMNKKYADASYEFINDSLEVMNYVCKKVKVKLKDGKVITAYYTSLLNNNCFAKLEPAFAGIPGLVLKYEYENDDAKFSYTASAISFAITGPEIYRIP